MGIKFVGLALVKVKGVIRIEAGILELVGWEAEVREVSEFG